ncbi:MAG: hypothetical protein JO095_17720 [Alphaproteobacteria bacterium]|nr:hypothetical protein [Alphaproteobacteria bacterium]
MKFAVSAAIGVFVLLAEPARGQQESSAPAPSGTPAAEVRLLQTLPAAHAVYPLVGLQSGTYSVTWSPDGERLAAYTLDGRKVEIWDRDGNVVREIRRYGLDFLAPHVLDFIPGHSKLIMAPSTTDPVEGAALTTENRTSPLNHVVFSMFDIDTGMITNVEGPEPNQLPGLDDQNPCAHSRRPRDIMVQGWATSLFHAWQQ